MTKVHLPIPSDYPEETIELTETQKKIVATCSRVRELLLEKNRKYGNSAISPVRIFSSASPKEQLRVRIDDKLSRVFSGQKDDSEDVVLDLIGYLILYLIASEEE